MLILINTCIGLLVYIYVYFQRVRVPCNLVASNTHTLTAHTSDVTSVAFSTNTLASCSSDLSVRLWDASDYSERSSSPLLGHKYTVSRPTRGVYSAKT